MSETAVLGGMNGWAPAMSQTRQIGSEPAASGGFLDWEDISEAFELAVPRKQAEAARD